MKSTEFIIIDDNKLNCYIAEKMIKKIDPEIAVKPFIYANEAFEFIRNPSDGFERHVILVDIQMPLMSGFNFVEEFERLADGVKDKYKLYIYSSTINEQDKLQANNYSTVRHFFSKPLTHNALTILLKDLDME
ncbi:MAG: response regulator [Sphingobacteriales bacterium]|nr:MAG: response regulator [Sphingobacteriales bacterium]